MVETKLQGVFKDYSPTIFEYSNEELRQFIDTVYRPRCQSLIDGDDDAADMFDDNVGAPEFIRVVKAIVKL